MPLRRQLFAFTDKVTGGSQGKYHMFTPELTRVLPVINGSRPMPIQVLKGVIMIGILFSTRSRRFNRVISRQTGIYMVMSMNFAVL